MTPEALSGEACAGTLILQSLLRVMVEMEIHPSVILQDISLVGVHLFVVPFDGLAEGIKVIFFIIPVPFAHFVFLFKDGILYKRDIVLAVLDD